MGTITERLQELGLFIPTPVAPVANYVGFVQMGTLVFTAGQLPIHNGTLEYPGKVGETVSVEDAARAARTSAINVLAQVQAACGGDLDRVRRIVKLVGFVNATPDFIQHPQVINGASDLMVEVFGDIGKHARSAVGVGSLPLGAAVEVEAIVEIAL